MNNLVGPAEANKTPVKDETYKMQRAKEIALKIKQLEDFTKN